MNAWKKCQGVLGVLVFLNESTEIELKYLRKSFRLMVNFTVKMIRKDFTSQFLCIKIKCL